MGAVVNSARKAYHFAKKIAGIKEPVDPNPFPTDAWTDPAYQDWFETHKATAAELEGQRTSSDNFELKPKFSFIVPLYKTPLDYLAVMADSVLGQTYGNLELVLANASLEMTELKAAVAGLAAKDGRVKLVELAENLGITENTNAGIAASTGDFCCFLDHDDFIEPNLLFEYVKAINEEPEIDFLYCDEDLVLQVGETDAFQHMNPMFKVGYSPELLLCKNAAIHLMTVRRAVIDQMPARTAAYDGSQDYNMTLFCTSRARKVRHVAKVLYHWRISENSTATNPDSKPYSLYSCRKAIYEQFIREGIEADIVSSGIYLLHNPWFRGMRDAKVSVVVDMQPWVKEQASPAARAYNTIDSFVEYFAQNNSLPNVEVVLVGEGLETRGFDGPFSVVACSGDEGVLPRLNRAASQAAGDYLVFLDGGCFFDTPEPLEQLIGACSLEGVGVAAPKVLYRNGRNKTYGVAVTSERVMPLYRGYEDDFPGYQCNIRSFQNSSACGLQGLTISRELFEKLGGFDEDFVGELGAVDLCHRVLEQGLRVANLCTVKLRTADVCSEHYFVCAENAPDYPSHEVAKFDKKWPGVRAAGDPYFNPNLDQSSSYCQVARG